MKSVIVGTAGHIDHGKSALVKALTGTDPDRLAEEKRRGITIDLGFAHLELPTATGEILRLGFVDVPGHERFVRNMLAGVGGIDLVLLVIAADESIKPQTREHFDICRLLEVRRGITVVTKSDLVDRDMLEVVRLEVEDFLRGSFLDPAHAPLISVSAKTGAGIAELKQALAHVANEVLAKDATAIARLPIDRVFVMKGFGTVVTGTLVAGKIHREEELEVFPTGRRVRVRGVQVHGEQVEEAIAGQRTALNLAGASAEDLARGMMLAPSNLLRASSRLDVSLSLLRSTKPLKDRARAHLHAYSSETIADVLLFGRKQLAPGESGLARLRIATPMLLLPGDRFILRQFSPVITIGGGVVLDATPLSGRTDVTKTAAFLEKLSAATPTEVLALRVDRRGKTGLSVADATIETGWRREQVAVPSSSQDLLRFGEVLVSAQAFQGLKSEAIAAVSEFHSANPLVAGISKEHLRETLGLSAEVFSGLLQELLQERKLEIAGEQVRIAGRAVVLKDVEAESKKVIEQAFASAGLKVPALKDVLAGLRVDRARAQKIVTLLMRDKVLVKVSDDLVFHRDALDQLRRNVVAQKARSPKMGVAEFKELTGITRKYAIPLLEYLDRERVTRRVGDERVIL
jgi:selenocysteine-specific elongation factor